jgi:hypothetical protein
VFWPHASATVPLSGRLDYASIVLATLATAALVTKRAEAIPVIAACGLAGLALWGLGLQAAV